MGAATAVWFAPSCIATGPDLSQITGHDDAGFQFTDAGPLDAPTDLPPTDPHEVIGADPSHGPFTGGGRVIVRGNGFSGDVTVTFGGVPATSIVPVDATKVQVTVPPGTAGPVDITAQNGADSSTKRTLVGGYTYDALYADPASGPISGGNEVHFYGQATKFDATTTAFIDQVPCASTQIVSPTELICVAPKGTPGSKTLRAVTGSEVIDVLDGYTYQDSTNGYKGGLSGSPLAGQLKVLVYDSYLGDPVPAASVIVGSNISTALVKQVDTSGVAFFQDPSLSSPKTVTVAAPCMSPITFVDDPVDTVTVYLDPILSPLCGSSGDPPGVGSKYGSSGGVSGEIVFPMTQEFKPGAWTVPQPIGNEQMVAYIFPVSSSPSAPFNLPPISAAILPSEMGTVGYKFSFYTSPGNVTLYALAGLEDPTKSPPTFTAYVMGVVRGVPVLPSENVKDTYIKMDSPLDEALTVTPHPPAAGPTGPDRIDARTAIRLGNDGFAILPGAQKAPLLPLNGGINFVGVPGLTGGLAGATYLVSARAVTGPDYGTPMSVVSSLQATTTAFPIDVGGFVGVPILDAPVLNTAWDGQHLTTHFAAGGSPIDLIVYNVTSGNGLQHWTIAAPPMDLAVTLPAISDIMGAALAAGPIDISVFGAQIASFKYGALRYRNLYPYGMNAYSLDTFPAHLQ